MRFNQNAKKIYARKAAEDPLFWNKYNKDLGKALSTGECPGHFGQGTGTKCFVCKGRI